MRLRPNVRAPTRFEDEEATFKSSPQKKKVTVPAFPDKLVAQVVPFDKNVRPAAFPSLPLNEPKPASLSNSIAPQDGMDNAIDTSSSQPEVTGLHEISLDGLTETADLRKNNESSPILRRELDEEQSLVTWSSLELSVQYTIWLNFRRKYTHDDAVELLGLSQEEGCDIRVAVEKRRQCPIDSTQTLAWLWAVEDFDGSLMASFTPYLLHAASYELALPQGVDKGRRFLEQLNLRDPSSYLGSWDLHPDGGGYLRSLSKPSSKTRTQQVTTTTNAGSPPQSGSNQNLQFAFKACPGDTKSIKPVRTQIAGRFGDAEYRHSMQANAEQIRLLQISKPQQCKTIPQKRPHDATSFTIIFDQRSPDHQSEDPINLVRRPICIKNGQSAHAMTATPPPPTPNMSLKRVLEQTRGSGGLSTPSRNEEAAGKRSSGSMSLRSRNRLRDMKALTDLKETMNFWDEDLIVESVSESEDDPGDVRTTSGKKIVSMKVDNRNALASIFLGEERIDARPVAFKVRNKHDSPPSSDPLEVGVLDSDISIPISSPAPVLSDAPELFVRYFTHDKFPIDEKQRLLSKPIDKRNNVEMWLIYGTNAWKTDCPWNTGRAFPRFKQPAPGIRLDREQAGSVIGRCLVDEWNRYQNQGVGQGVVEETCIGLIMIETYHQRLRLDQQKQQLVLDEKFLQRFGHIDQSFAMREIDERHRQEVKTLEGKLRRELNKAYACRFEELGIQPPNPDLTLQNKNQERRTGDLPFSGAGRAERTTISTAETPSQISHSISENDFTRKLIEMSSTAGRRLKTPPETDLGVFGSDDAETTNDLNHMQSPTVGNTSVTATDQSNTQDFDNRPDSSPLRGCKRKKSEPHHKGCNNSGIIEKRLLSDDVAMSEAPPVTVSKPGCGSLTTDIRTPRISQGWSPKSPSYSPISENDVFHSVYDLPTAQLQEGVKEKVNSVSDDANTILQGLISPDAAPANEASTVEVPPMLGGTKEQQPNDGFTEAPKDEAVTPSVETEGPFLKTTQVGAARSDPSLKLNFNQSIKLAIADGLGTTSTSHVKKSQLAIKPAVKGEERIPAQNLISRVTRSTTGTPAPKNIIPLASKSESKAISKGTVKPTRTKKSTAAKAGALSHSQLEIVKQENSIESPSSAETEAKPKAKATPKSRGKVSTRSTSKVPTISPVDERPRQRQRIA